MRALQLAALVLVIALIPSTSAAPVDPVTALAPVVIWADGLGGLRGLATDNEGRLYVADRDTGTVHRVDAGGGRVLVADGLDRPVGLAIDASGRLLIVEERAGRVVRLEADGRRVVLVANVAQPRWLALAPDGALYISARALVPDGGPQPDDESLEPQVVLRLSPTGRLTEFAAGFVGLQGLAADDRAVYAAARTPQGAGSGQAALFSIDRNADGTAGAVALVANIGGTAAAGVALDRLGNAFVATSGSAGPGLLSGAIVRVGVDRQTTMFASNLASPAGLAFDPAGNLAVADAAAGRIVQFQAPATPAFGALPAYAREPAVSIGVATQPGAQVLVSTSGEAAVAAVADTSGAASLVVPLISNRANTLTAWAVGAGGAGLVSPATEASLTHDDTAPAITIQAPKAADFVRQMIAVRADVSDSGSGVASVGITVDGKPATAALAPAPPAQALSAAGTWDAGPMADGIHTLTVTASDQAGNTRAASRTVTVDTTPPTTSITAASDRVALDATATFAFTGSDNLTPTAALAFSWRLDDGPWSPYTASTTAILSALSADKHTFEVRARDLAGNEDPAGARRVFTVAGIGGSNNARPPAAFTLTLTQTSSPVLQGSRVSFGVLATGAAAASSMVDIAVGGLPSGVTATLVPRRLVPGHPGQLTLHVAADAPPGAHTFTLTGSATATRHATPSASVTGSITIIAGGRTALVGRVVDTDRQPLAGVAVTLDTLSATTDAYGNFLMLDPPVGDQVVLIDGAPASGPGKRYPTIPVSMTIVAGRVNELPHLPHLHRQHERFTPIHPTQKTVATDPDLPGVALHLDGDNKIIGWDGQPADKVSIRSVPVDRLPVKPVPPEVNGRTVYMFYFDKRGGGIPARPVPFEAPNELGLKPGEKARLWYFDESPRRGEAPNDWRVAGTATVSEDGLTIRTDPGVGIPKFCCGAVVLGAGNSDSGFAPSGLPEAGMGASGADPVELSTGVFVLTATDLVIPGRIPITIRRSYRSGDSNGGPFGTGTMMTHNEYLQRTSDAVLTFIYDGDARSRFTRQADGSFINTTTPAFRGATIRANTDGTSTLRYKDGRTLTFRMMMWGLGYASAVADANGNTLTIVRDDLANPVSIVDPAGRSVAITWQPLLHITKVTDPIGRTVLYEYEGNLLTAVTNPAGGVTRYTYDEQARMTSITDARGITFLTNTYDVNSRVCQQTQADGGLYTMYYITADIATTPASLQLLDEAAAGGPITQAPCAAAPSYRSPVVATVLVDPRGYPTTYRFNSAGAVLSVTNALGQTTTYTRDPDTNLMQSITDPLNRTTQFTYDTAGNVTSITDALGHVRSFTYDPTFNKVTSATDPLNHTTTFGYDSRGNVTSVTDPLNNRTTIAYNAAGQPTSVTDPLNQATTFTYDSVGNLLTVADPFGNTTTRSYDAVSRLLSQSNPLDFTTKRTYDVVNRVTSVRDARNGLTQFTYDPNGNLLSVTDALGHTTAYTYDAMDRAATRTDPLGHSESFTYDLAGNLVQHTDRKGQGATFGYDAVNRRTGAMYVDATVSYVYDAAGRLTEATDSVGGTITNAYDVLDRLTSQATAQATVSYTYDAAGRRATMTVPGQAPTAYAYDNANRLTSITQGASLVQFAYDAASRRTSLTLPNGVRTEYGYDAASRLTALTYKLDTTVLGDLQYAYDPAGRRVAVGGTWARTGLPPALAAATYNAGNQQATFGPQSLTNDLNGNLTADGANTYTWDARNRLVAIGGATSAGFVYDAAGRRSRTTINGSTTDFVYDGLNAVREASDSTVVNTLAGLGIDEHFARLEGSGAMRGLLTDALGSTIALTDAAGAVQTDYTYEPFGVVTGDMGDNPFQYTGRENDRTGLYYYRARYHHARFQRFISEDPIRLRGGINLYAYVRNNPLRFTDPKGLQVPCYPGPVMGPECRNPDSDRTPGCDAACQREWIERNQEPLADILMNLVCFFGKLHCGPSVPGLPPYPRRPSPPETFLPVLPSSAASAGLADSPPAGDMPPVVDTPPASDAPPAGSTSPAGDTTSGRKES